MRNAPAPREHAPQTRCGLCQEPLEPLEPRRYLDEEACHPECYTAYQLDGGVVVFDCEEHE